MFYFILLYYNIVLQRFMNGIDAGAGQACDCGQEQGVAVAESSPSRVFVIYTHGCLPLIDDDKPVMVDSLVDTFTTAKIGFPLITEMAFDPPEVHFIHNLFGLLAHERTGVLTKPQLKGMIRRALCKLRGVSIVRDTCKFRCHRKGKKIAEMVLFAHGEPIAEGIFRLDPQTGVIKDVSGHFGLIEKSTKSLKEFPSEKKYDIPFIEKRKSMAEGELSRLQTGISKIPKQNHAEFRKVSHLIEAKWQLIQALDTILRGKNRESRFEFPSHIKRKHPGDFITLSGLMQNAIASKVVNPETDVVVVFACRGPMHPLSDLSGLRSPRDSDESASEGGRMRVRTKSKNQKKSKVNPNRKYTRKR